MSKLNVGDPVESDFGVGKVVAITKDWLIYSTDDSANEVCLFIKDMNFWIPVDNLEPGHPDNAFIEVSD